MTCDVQIVQVVQTVERRVLIVVGEGEPNITEFDDENSSQA